MFPSHLLKRIDEDTVKINSILGKGIAVEHMKYVEEYVDSVFRINAKSFPSCLRYIGPRRCTPMEELAIATKKKASKRASKRIFDTAISYIYLMEYMFEFTNPETGEVKKIPRYIYLPFVESGGRTYISGSRFVVAPILADRVLSVGIESVFIRLLKARITLNRTPHHYIANGHRESPQVVWGPIHNKTATGTGGRSTAKAKCSLAHYFFCKYGFVQAFQRFAGCTPIVETIATFTEDKYPSDQYIACHSMYKLSTAIPKGFKRLTYEASEIVLVIRKDEYTAMAKNLISGFFYVVDHFPDRLRAEYLESTRLWTILLGYLIWNNNEVEGKLFADANEHINSLDEYLDFITQRKLLKLGYVCKDIYELFAVVVDKFDEWQLTAEDKVSTMYGKELSVVPFICYDLTCMINNFCFKLKAAQKKPLTEMRLLTIMNQNLKMGEIFKISKSCDNVSTTSACGDNMALKLTCLLVPQQASSGKKRSRTGLSDRTKILSASIAEVGQYAALSKAGPTGRDKVALTLQLDQDGLALRNPEYATLIDEVQEQIRR